MHVYFYLYKKLQHKKCWKFKFPASFLISKSNNYSTTTESTGAATESTRTVSAAIVSTITESEPLVATPVLPLPQDANMQAMANKNPNNAVFFIKMFIN